MPRFQSDPTPVPSSGTVLRDIKLDIKLLTETSMPAPAQAALARLINRYHQLDREATELHWQLNPERMGR